MKRWFVIGYLLLAYSSLATAQPVQLSAGSAFAAARSSLYAAGWRADPKAHATVGEYAEMDRQLIERGFLEVDFCSVGKTSCIFQYTRGKSCLRLRAEGEQVETMKVQSWSAECREPGPDDAAAILPADVRYMLQWREDCKTFGTCKGSEQYLHKLKKKYARDRHVMEALNFAVSQAVAR